MTNKSVYTKPDDPNIYLLVNGVEYKYNQHHILLI